MHNNKLFNTTKVQADKNAKHVGQVRECVRTSMYKLHKVLAKQTWYPARERFGQLLQLIVDATI